ncbi:class I SAM-dependent RNA methyltransferase [Serpentinicella sp. ANB-PHB4]|uniref:THUMP domain-containing class I SAM-dependent RNA methyltransferase n=1 Tax=Serpentinicella sp. ANB-PHB4 TaxID=3074076 RepID=UPI002860D39D|nr:class I SAM-dependent RNA methyltransferase [Serpentinicella sp. ANB-PHB4]MDR5660078.1 class I SAM-dependent RNA methyltransferase [Serpentinicella sp. ANB-PHB4]
MKKVELIATATFGLEAIVKREVIDLGFEDIKTDNAMVTFKGDLSSIPKANLWLRCADRVLLKLGEFNATTFDQLFEQTKALPWEEWIPEDGKFTVTGKSINSKLFSVPDCQSIVKKAIVEKLKKKYNVTWFSETGPEYTVQVSLLKDKAILTIDTSGTGLHKRGYRENSVQAPIKETLAAALVKLSFWNKDRLLLDPFCGSGTLPIEAAMIGRNIAPGLNRSFASEKWSIFKPEIWKNARVDALKSIDQNVQLKIKGTDIDPEAIEIAKENAFEAGVDDCIEFDQKPLGELDFKDEYGVIICNPPYGERLSEVEEVEKLYTSMGNYFENLNTWSKYIITSFEEFENFYGKKADKKRKLYNGRIKVDYYQYFGPRPPKSIT